MNDPLFFMQILKRFSYLNDYVPTQVLAKVGQSNYLVEELSARAQFQNDEVVLRRLRERNEFDDIRMVQLSHYLDFLEDVRSLVEAKR